MIKEFLRILGTKCGNILDAIISQEQALKIKESKKTTKKLPNKNRPETYEELMKITKKRMDELRI